MFYLKKKEFLKAKGKRYSFSVIKWTTNSNIIIFLFYVY